MGKIDLNEFLFRVDRELLRLTTGTFSTVLDVGIKGNIHDQLDYRAALEKLIKEAPNTYVREWLEQQLEKAPKPRTKEQETQQKKQRVNNESLSQKPPSENELPILKLSSSPVRGWIEKLERSDNIAKGQAEEIAVRPEISTILCAALQTTSNDAFEIAKITTPILLGLVFAGALAIPLYPTLFAAVALIIARAGIASFCAGLEKRNSKGK